MSHTVPVATPTNSGLTSRQSKTDLWLFRCTVELARIQETITVSTFNTPGTRTGSGIQELGVLVGVAVEHEKLMSIWKHALPEYLRFGDLDLNRPGDGQKLTLYSRYQRPEHLI
jgi:hypothetical protein